MLSAAGYRQLCGGRHFRPGARSGRNHRFALMACGGQLRLGDCHAFQEDDDRNHAHSLFEVVPENWTGG